MNNPKTRFPVISACLLIGSIASSCAYATRIAPTAIPPTTAHPTTAQPFATNIASFTPTAKYFAQSLNIFQPGQGSRLVSPIQLTVDVPPGDGVLRAELVGNDTTLLWRDVLPTRDSDRVEVDIPFEIRGEENARLLVSRDDQFNRVVELRSVEIQLLESGTTLPMPPSEQETPHIDLPQAGQTVSGGLLSLSGRVAPGVEGPLDLRLVTRDRRVPAIANVYPAADGSFSAEVVYSLQQAEWVLVTVSQRQDGVTASLSSVEVWLEP